ncbi:MAG: DUF3299 domain-containing protein [Verrucomicrobiales bacterium]|nr:DUF3299 domain-containing protein [Verrucomicrobiales bacterium]
MRKQDNTAVWKWLAMKAVVLALVCLAAYVVFINPPERQAEGPALTREQLDSQSDVITELAKAEPEQVFEVTGPETNAPPVSVPPLLEKLPTQSETTNLITFAEDPATETNLIELAPPVEELPPLPEEIDGYKTVTFDKLASFAYEVPLDPVTNKVELAKLNAQIPDGIKQFDEKPVAIRGFMLPLKVENGKVTELLIMRDQSMCCFGTVPKINEWISIKMEGDGVEPIMDQAVTLMGQLKVGEVLENDYLVGIYEMLGDKMIGPLDL